MTKYTKIYDSYYTFYINGYRAEKDSGTVYEILKDVRISWQGNDTIDGWEVLNSNNKRLFYAGTLREAKQFVENCCD